MNNEKDNTPDPSEAQVGATEAVNRAFSSATSKAKEIASSVAAGVEEDSAGGSQGVLAHLKADALAVLRIGQVHMIVLLIGVAAIAAIIALMGWGKYVAYVTTYYSGLMGGTMRFVLAVPVVAGLVALVAVACVVLGRFAAIHAASESAPQGEA